MEWWITARTIDRVCRAQSCAVGTETRNPRAVREASQIQRELCRFLEKVLAEVGGDDWWQRLVVDQLSFQQQRYVEQRDVKRLESLDLAALLRVLDRNWYEISWKVTQSPDARHYVKEMQTVRNRWAHASVEEYSRDDIYRDLDTLQRILTAIDASDELQDRVRKEREALLGREQPASGSADDTPPTGIDGQVEGVAFQPTQMVRLKSDSSKMGPVIEVQELQAENT